MNAPSLTYFTYFFAGQFPIETVPLHQPHSFVKHITSGPNMISPVSGSKTVTFIGVLLTGWPVEFVTINSSLSVSPGWYGGLDSGSPVTGFCLGNMAAIAKRPFLSILRMIKPMSSPCIMIGSPFLRIYSPNPSVSLSETLKSVSSSM